MSVYKLQQDSAQIILHATNVRRPCRRERGCCSETDRQRVRANRTAWCIHRIELRFSFNKQREDFPDLKSYNDYLEEVEDISTLILFWYQPPASTHSYLAFNLINDIDVEETHKRIAKYRQENAALIQSNIQREQDYAKALQEADEAAKRERHVRAEELRQAEELERHAIEAEKQALIDSLEQSDADAHRLVAKSRAEAVKRAKERTRDANRAVHQSAATLLRSRAAQSANVPDVPHVPLQDDWDAYEDKYSLLNSYYDPVSEAVRKDREGIMRAGGYRVEDAWERAVRSAVAGLDIPPLGSIGQATSVVSA